VGFPELPFPRGEKTAPFKDLFSHLPPSLPLPHKEVPPQPNKKASILARGKAFLSKETNSECFHTGSRGSGGRGRGDSNKGSKLSLFLKFGATGEKGRYPISVARKKKREGGKDII